MSASVTQGSRKLMMITQCTLVLFYHGGKLHYCEVTCRKVMQAYESVKVQDTKKSSKIRHLGTIAQLCRAMSSQLRHISTM